MDSLLASQEQNLSLIHIQLCIRDRDKPIIQYLVDEAVASGIEEILLVVGRKKEVVEDYFSEDKELQDFLIERGKESFIPQITNLSGKAKIHFIEEEGGAKGLGHAIYMAKDFVGNEPFAIMYGDVIMQGEKPCLKEIIEQHEKLGGSVIGCLLYTSRCV